ncbi:MULTISPECIES: hypothetical protein [Caballeronia]|nr:MULTISPECIES: hypothetical protein [Caballeronia]MDR5790558.1 hypothetical protein [Caballeronia sp. LP003]
MSKAFAQSLKIVDFMDRFKTASSDECPLRENNSGSRGAEMFALEGTRANLSTRGVAVHTEARTSKTSGAFRLFGGSHARGARRMRTGTEDRMVTDISLRGAAKRVG